MKENLEKINKIQQIILNYDFHDVSPDEYKKYKSIILTRIQKLATFINYASVFSQLDQIVVEFTNTMKQPDIKMEEIADFLKNLIDGYIKEIIPDVVGLRKSSLSTIILKILGKKMESTYKELISIDLPNLRKIINEIKDSKISREEAENLKNTIKDK